MIRITVAISAISLLLLPPVPPPFGRSSDMESPVFNQETDRAQECLGRIRVGTTLTEGERVLKQYGFKFVRGCVLSDATLIYEQKDDPAAIILSVNLDGVITGKELVGRQISIDMWRGTCLLES